MKRPGIFLLLFLVFFCSICLAQDKQTDSLKAVLANAPEDSNKVNTLIALSKSYFSTSPDEALRLGIAAKELSEKINYKKGIALALKNTGLTYYKQGKYVEALVDWEQSKKIFENIDDKKGVANMLSNIGIIYFDQADDEKALDFNLKSLKIAEEIKDSMRIMTVLVNIGGIYGKKRATYDQAIDYDKKALPYSEAFEDNDAIGTITANLGEIYLNRGDDTTALYYFEKSLKAYEGSENVPYSLNYIGKVYAKRGDYNKAISFQKDAYEKAKKLDSKLDMAKSLEGLAETYQHKGDIQLALETYNEAETLTSEIGANLELKIAYEGLATAYAKMKDYSNAFKYQTLLLGIKDTLYNIDTDKKLGTLLFNFENEKKQAQINLLTKDKEIQQQEIKRQKIVRNGFIGGFAIVLLFAVVFLSQRNRISKEKKRSDELLLNILPEETAEELKATGSAKAKSFDLVTVMFTDFKNFTQVSERLSAEELVHEINHCYSEFDKIVIKHGIEKIKTIGDSYMCAGGLPTVNTSHPDDVVKAGLEMQDFIARNNHERLAKGQPFFELRLGIHTGPLVAGIVGIRKFAYDIWGDTVNIASRMESSGEVGKVNISGTTYELVKDKFACIYRGKIVAKNKGEIDMYFVEKAI
ncbi:MAG: adenylate/guanylate cyclase domain-containing protein [Bacteroidia bacterium]